MSRSASFLCVLPQSGGRSRRRSGRDRADGEAAGVPLMDFRQIQVRRSQAPTKPSSSRSRSRSRKSSCARVRTRTTTRSSCATSSFLNEGDKAGRSRCASAVARWRTRSSACASSSASRPTSKNRPGRADAEDGRAPDDHGHRAEEEALSQNLRRPRRETRPSPAGSPGRNTAPRRKQKTGC